MKQQKKGKSKDTAVLRTLINQEAQNFATKRLLKDLKQLNDETIPTVGVTARPLEHDLFVWHANIRGPEKSLYEGGVFHLELIIPESYPHQAPSVNLFTELPHPNVFGKVICLDMLQPQRGKDGSGWTSAYSIQSVLLQLQSFLFEETITEDLQKTQAAIKKAVIAANSYKCTTQNCKHGGKLSLWPPFNQKETEEDAFIMTLSEDKLFEQELVCYHTKLPYKQSVLQEKGQIAKKQESCLGILLSVSKIPRSGLLKQALPSHDYISLKAFLNEGIKWDSLNNYFTHWLPLYFGNTDNKDRVMNLCERAISMIMTSNTRRFKPEYVLEVFPKITQTIVYQIMDEKTHASIRFLRLLTHIHALWLQFMESYPQLQDQVESTLQNFITNEKYRHKDFTPNLGILLNLLYVSNTTKFHDIIFQYAAEQLDRQVFWLLKEIPELDDEKIRDKIDPVQRVNISFKQQATGFQMGCFQLTYLQLVRDRFKSLKELSQSFDSYFSRLPTKLEEQIQRKVFEILKTVVDYDSFYKFIGVKPKTIEEMDIQLKQAVENSKSKKYHGTIEEVNELPPTSVQLGNYLQVLPKVEDVYTVTQVKIEGQKNQYQHEIQQVKNLTENQWKKMCSDRWQWIADELYWESNLTATQVAGLANERNIKGYKVTRDRLSNDVVQRMRGVERQFFTQKSPLVEQSWELLFLKLDMEEIILYMDSNPDFQKLYSRLALAGKKLTNLCIPLRKIQNIQSGYYFITAILESLPKLEQLIFAGVPGNQTAFPKKLFRAVYKGFNNLAQKPHALQSILWANVSSSAAQAETTDCVFSPLTKFLDTIHTLEFEQCQLLSYTNAAKACGNLITNIKTLSELNLRSSINNAAIAKEITDGLMRAKQIQYVDISFNHLITDKGMASMLYNLAFSPKLTHLNVSNCSSIAAPAEVVESLYKLLRISASLEELDMSYLSQLNKSLNKEFFISLGEIKTLRVLNMSNSGLIDQNNAFMLGKAIAFNAKKNGNLERLYLNGCISSYERWDQVIKNMSISEQDHEIWYGDSTKASKMSGGELQKKYYCNLKSVKLGQGGQFASGFSLSSFKQAYKPEIPNFLTFIQQSQKLTSLDLSERQLTKNEAELFYLTLDPTRSNLVGNLIVLNLSKNNLLKEGAKIIGQILTTNKTIEFLDISKNFIGVSGGQALAQALTQNSTLKQLNLFNNKIGYDGAKAFAETFRINQTLEFIEFGHNRIRNKGLHVLAEALGKNPQSAIKILGLRFNFLTEEGVIHFLRVVLGGQQNQSKISELYIKNNQINEYGLFMLKKFFNEQSLKVKIDLFQKLPIIEEQRLERTIWVHPAFDEEQIREFFQNTHDCGVILDVRIRKGPKYPNRNQAQNSFNMIEFADKASVNRAMNLASKKLKLNEQGFRVLKAGSGTFLYSKKSSKQKKAETSKTKIVAPVGQGKNARGGGARFKGGRGRGRGRGR